MSYDIVKAQLFSLLNLKIPLIMMYSILYEVIGYNRDCKYNFVIYILKMLGHLGWMGLFRSYGSYSQFCKFYIYFSFDDINVLSSKI
jgi:hypothetical protein